MADIPKTRANNPIVKNCGDIGRIYLITKALQILSHIRSIFYQ